jgi:hypothetical protein
VKLFWLLVVVVPPFLVEAVAALVAFTMLHKLLAGLMQLQLAQVETIRVRQLVEMEVTQFLAH